MRAIPSLPRNYGDSDFREEDQSRLELLNARIQQLGPNLRPEDVRKLARLELKLEQMEEAVRKIQRKYGLNDAE